MLALHNMLSQEIIGEYVEPVTSLAPMPFRDACIIFNQHEFYETFHIGYRLGLFQSSILLEIVVIVSESF